MLHELIIQPRAERDIRRLPRSVRPRVIEAINALATTPRPPGCLKMSGRENTWRIRAGDYRILYQVDDAAETVTVTDVGDRRDVYDN
jgi:mRNA interferase RelE/StbE